MIVEVDKNLTSYFDDDPVRHHLSKEFRTTDNRKSYALIWNGIKSRVLLFAVHFAKTFLRLKTI